MKTDATADGLLPGDVFHSANLQRTGRVGDLLGEGGQGAVYAAEFGNGVFALKWYHDYYIEIDLTLRDRLQRAISRGAPDKRFLWPLELVAQAGRPNNFGYIMALRPEEFRSIREVLAPRPDRIELSLEKRMFVCWQIADSFLNLHANGFCYQDINFGNFFVHPHSAQVMICDNDNVNIDGAEASVYGTRKFMAPEIVRREATPDSHTDLYSMAVLFFYVIVGWHPLDGKREAEVKLLTPLLELSLYGTETLFMFDEADASNGPVSPLHDMLVCRWNSLPQSLRKLFRRAFGPGLQDPRERVLEKEWLREFASFQKAVYPCANCRYEHVYSVSQPAACVYCGEPLNPPPVLLIGEKRIALGPDAVLSAVDLGKADAAAWESVGVVVEHPTKPGVFGLRNNTNDAWRGRSPSGKLTTVSPGKAVMLANGLQIEIGTFRAVVHAAENPQPGSGAATGGADAE